MPIVCAVAPSQGEPYDLPRRRDTAQPAFAITGSLPDKALKVSVEAERLYAIAAESGLPRMRRGCRCRSRRFHPSGRRP